MDIGSTTFPQPSARRYRITEVLQSLMQINVTPDSHCIDLSRRFSLQDLLSSRTELGHLMEAGKDEGTEGVGLLRLDTVPACCENELLLDNDVDERPEMQLWNSFHLSCRVEVALTIWLWVIPLPSTLSGSSCEAICLATPRSKPGGPRSSRNWALDEVRRGNRQSTSQRSCRQSSIYPLWDCTSHPVTPLAIGTTWFVSAC